MGGRVVKQKPGFYVRRKSRARRSYAVAGATRRSLNSEELPAAFNLSPDAPDTGTRAPLAWFAPGRLKHEPTGRSRSRTADRLSPTSSGGRESRRRRP